jgi:hypothetical protein
MALPNRAKTCPGCGQAVYTTADVPGAAHGRRVDGCLADVRRASDFAAVPNISSLPPRVDLRPGCSRVEDQGQVGSCTANAIVGAIEFKRWKSGLQEDLSRLFLYYNARRMRGAEHEDSGIPIAHGMEALSAYGVPPERSWPYDPGKVTIAPDAAAYDHAAAVDEIEYARVEGIEHIKGALAREHPVVFSISLPDRCYQEAAHSGMIPVPTDAELTPALSLFGQHAMLLVGYDSDQQILHVRNSWGADWGDRGYCRLTVDTFQRASAVTSTWVVGSLEASGAFAVVRPALPVRQVEGSVLESAARLRDEIRVGLARDIGDALKDVRRRASPDRR